MKRAWCRNTAEKWNKSISLSLISHGAAALSLERLKCLAWLNVQTSSYLPAPTIVNKQTSKKLGLRSPEATRSSLTPAGQTHFQLDHVIHAAIFFVLSLGICVSGVFKATSSRVNRKHALLLFAATRLMGWPGEPCSDCLARLSASWLWAELSGDNVYQILLLSHTLCIHAAARRHEFIHTQRRSHTQAALCQSSKQFSDSLMLRNFSWCLRKPRQWCWNMSSAFLCVYFGGWNSSNVPEFL